MDLDRSLWRTDGTASGTRELGRYERVFRERLVLGEHLVFVACTRTAGCEMHASDGTVEGTRMLVDSLPSRKTEHYSPRPTVLGQIDDRVLFVVPTDDGLTLWTTNGTPEGTHVVTNLPTFFSYTSAYTGGKVYFTGFSSPGTRATSLWVSDGTEEGTRQVWEVEEDSEFIEGIDFAGGKTFVTTTEALYVSANGVGDFRRVESMLSTGTSSMTGVGDSLYVRSGGRLKHYDASTADEGTLGTLLATGLDRYADPIRHVLGDTVYFVRRGDVWVTDGTDEGTFQMTDQAIIQNFASTDSGFTVISGRIEVAENEHRDVLWISDGTEEGSKTIQGSLRPSGFGQVGLSVMGPWVDAFEKGVVQLLVDDSGSLVSVDDVLSTHGLDSAQVPTDVGLIDTDYFLGNDPIRGRELWRWEGNVPVLVKEFFADPLTTDVSHVFASGLYTYVIEDRQLWRTDGSPDGTEQIRFPTKFAGYVEYGGQVDGRHAVAVRYPANDSGTYHELWGINGDDIERLTESRQYTHYFDASGSLHPETTPESVWFEYYYGESNFHVTWHTDVTPAGTDRFFDSAGLQGSWTWAAVIDDGVARYSHTELRYRTQAELLRHDFQQPITATKKFGDSLLVAVSQSRGQAAGLWLWNKESVRKIVDLPSRMSGNFASFDEQFLFRVGSSLWTTDGSVSGTHVLKEGISPALLGAAGDAFLFSARAVGTGRELWRTDGTAAGTVPLADLNPGQAGTQFSTMPPQESNGKLYFFANDRTHGMELWSTDGTAEGTGIVEETIPGAEAVRVQGFSVSEDRIVMRTEASTHRQLLVMTPDPNPADADRDGEVGFKDLLLLSYHFRQSGASQQQGDFDGDGIVDEKDLEILAQNYGQLQKF